MSILLHVVIALASIAVASYGYVRPSKLVLRTAYSLVGMTLASGLYVVWNAPAHMVQACISGLVYIGVISIAIVAIKAKLTAVQDNL